MCFWVARWIASLSDAGLWLRLVAMLVPFGRIMSSSPAWTAYSSSHVTLKSWIKAVMAGLVMQKSLLVGGFLLLGASHVGLSGLLPTSERNALRQAIRRLKWL